MKTGAHLKVVSLGDNVLGVNLEGNPRKPEPDSFRVHFPGGAVDIERCTDNSYWVHVICDSKDSVESREGPQDQHGRPYARFSEARLHMTTKHTSEAVMGDFVNPGLYDVALRVTREAVSK